MRTSTLLHFALLTSYASGQWIREEALPGTEIPSVYVHQEGLFAGGVNTVYHQPAAGTSWETWQILPGDPVYVDAVIFFNGEAHTGTGGSGSFRSPDAATPWQVTPGHAGMGANFVMGLVDFNGELYSATAGGGTFKYTGNTWQPFGDLAPYGGLNVNFLRVIGDTLWCGAGGNGFLFHAVPGATGWTPVQVDMVTGPSIDLTDIIAVDGGLLAASTVGLYRSMDQGASWTPIGGPAAVVKLTRWNDALIASRTGAITRWLRSTDDGLTWTQFSITPLSFGQVVHNGRLYAGRLDGLWYMEEPGTGMEERTEHPFLLYPNPASDVVHLRSPLKGPVNYTIHDMQGRIVLSGVVHGPLAILPVDQLEAGSYLVHIAQEHLVATEQLVVR